MTKLKTLKDLYDVTDFVGGYNKSKAGVMIYVKDIRQEAIKDIKEFERQKTSEWTFLFNPTKKEIDAIIQYIKYKFNITEEELK